MTNTGLEQLRADLFNILNDYGDFFLTDYPEQAETKSIHPTIKRIMSLFQSHEAQIKQDIFKKVDIVIGDDIEEVAVEPQETFTQRVAKAKYQNEYRAELRASLKALEEKEIG